MNRSLTTRGNTSFTIPSLHDIGRNLFFTDSIFDGVDEFFKDVNFPKFNTIKRGDDLEIEVALAGYNKDDLSIELSPENVLTVSSIINDDGDDGDDGDDDSTGDEFTYLHRGIASRNFKIAWKISAMHEVGKISYVNGMLRIPLKGKAPEKPKVKVLKID